jgi:hypothetical protein
MRAAALDLTLFVTDRLRVVLLTTLALTVFRLLAG